MLNIAAVGVKIRLKFKTALTILVSLERCARMASDPYEVGVWHLKMTNITMQIHHKGFIPKFLHIYSMPPVHLEVSRMEMNRTKGELTHA